MTTSAELQSQHAEMLKASAVKPEVSRARGCRSVSTKTELKELGFSNSQCRVPTLLLPVWGLHGEIEIYSHRPDEPRVDSKRGKAIKYEYPTGSKMCVDVHPFIKDRVRDPNIPLFITEGLKKADSAISQGLCCIALLGVWNWRGTNEYGGKTTLPEFESIALAKRKVYIAFDSDSFENPQVYGALSRFKQFLEYKKSTLPCFICRLDLMGVKWDWTITSQPAIRLKI